MPEIISDLLKWRPVMTFQDSLIIIDGIVPAIVGGAIGIFALLGLRELLKETKVAFK